MKNIQPIMKRRITGMAAVLAVVLPVLVTAPVLVLAHATVVSSTPPEGASVAPGITQIVINFNDELNLDASSATLEGASGMMPGATASVDRADRKKMVIQTPPLEAGKYTVGWKAVSADDNGITNGMIHFTVTAASGSDTGPSGTVTTQVETRTPGSNMSSSSLPTTGGGDLGAPALAAGSALGAALVVLGSMWRRRSRPEIRLN